MYPTRQMSYLVVLRRHVQKQAMAYKEAKPQTFVRIIALL
jgi:hypothetical protein